MATSPDTTQQVLAGVRGLLQRVSDIALPDDSILEVINDLCKEYVNEEAYGVRDRRTEVAPVTITPLTGLEADFTCVLTGVPDFEPQLLELSNNSGPLFVWREAVIVPMDSWARHYREGYVAAAFYGSNSLSTPCKVKLSLLDQRIADLQFRLTYRLPLLTIVQSGDKPPIPSAHLPMLKLEAAIMCKPRIIHPTEEFEHWWNNNAGIYTAKLGQLKEAWARYIDSSVEPQIQPIQRSDRHRRYQRHRIAPFIPTT